ncbi:MAG: hypothetical protein JSU87_04455 [Gemmatimonadota bacterium]|nr:MAG: hypothetical protein JSU87_04455 [Gemmatimonadota bacterium]
MGKINIGRVVTGGLLAGVVINALEFLLNEPILGGQWSDAMVALGLEEPSGMTLLWYVIWGFVLGIGIVWIYAAIRPRFGPGPKTAVTAGLAVWFLIWFLGFGATVLSGMFPTGLVLVTLVWELFEVPIAAVAGAWLYKEEGAAAAT